MPRVKDEPRVKIESGSVDELRWSKVRAPPIKSTSRIDMLKSMDYDTLTKVANDICNERERRRTMEIKIRRQAIESAVSELPVLLPLMMSSSLSSVSSLPLSKGKCVCV